MLSILLILIPSYIYPNMLLSIVTFVDKSKVIFSIELSLFKAKYSIISNFSSSLLGYPIIIILLEYLYHSS